MGKAKVKPIYTRAQSVLLSSVGLDPRVKHPSGTIEALEAMTPEQRARIPRYQEQPDIKPSYAGLSIVVSRKMLEGSEVRDVESVAVRKSSILPAVFWYLPDVKLSAVEEYFGLWHLMHPSQVVSLSERIGGGVWGGSEADTENDRARTAWNRARSQMSRKQAVAMETFFYAPDDACMSESQAWQVSTGAAKLVEYFAQNVDYAFNKPKRNNDGVGT